MTTESSGLYTQRLATEETVFRSFSHVKMLTVHAAYIQYGQLLLIFVANRLVNKDHFNGKH
jgi:hypothetical protein